MLPPRHYRLREAFWEPALCQALYKLCLTFPPATQWDELSEPSTARNPTTLAKVGGLLAQAVKVRGGVLSAVASGTGVKARIFHIAGPDIQLPR